MWSAKGVINFLRLFNLDKDNKDLSELYRSITEGKENRFREWTQDPEFVHTLNALHLAFTLGPFSPTNQFDAKSDSFPDVPFDDVKILFFEMKADSISKVLETIQNKPEDPDDETLDFDFLDLTENSYREYFKLTESQYEDVLAELRRALNNAPMLTSTEYAFLFKQCLPAVDDFLRQTGISDHASFRFLAGNQSPLLGADFLRNENIIKNMSFLLYGLGLAVQEYFRIEQKKDVRVDFAQIILQNFQTAPGRLPHNLLLDMGFTVSEMRKILEVLRANPELRIAFKEKILTAALTAYRNAQIWNESHIFIPAILMPATTLINFLRLFNDGYESGPWELYDLVVRAGNINQSPLFSHEHSQNLLKAHRIAAECGPIPDRSGIPPQYDHEIPLIDIQYLFKFLIPHIKATPNGSRVLSALLKDMQHDSEKCKALLGGDHYETLLSWLQRSLVPPREPIKSSLAYYAVMAVTAADPTPTPTGYTL